MQHELDALVRAYLEEVRSEAETVIEIVALVGKRRASHKQFFHDLARAIANNAMADEQAASRSQPHVGHGVEHLRSELDKAISNLEQTHRQVGSDAEQNIRFS